LSTVDPQIAGQLHANVSRDYYAIAGRTGGWTNKVANQYGSQILARTNHLAILNKELAAVFGTVVAVDKQRWAQSGYVVAFIGD